MKKIEYDFVKLTNYKIEWDEAIYHLVYVPPMALDCPQYNEPYLIYHRVEGHRMTIVEFATLMHYCDAFKPLMRKSVELNAYEICDVLFFNGLTFKFLPKWSTNEFKLIFPDTLEFYKDGKLYDEMAIPLRMLHQFVNAVFREFITVAELPENVRVTSSEEEFPYLTGNLENFVDEVIHWIDREYESDEDDDNYYYESYDYDDD